MNAPATLSRWSQPGSAPAALRAVPGVLFRSATWPLAWVRAPW